MPLGRATGVAVPRTDGGYVTAGPRGFMWVDEDGTVRHIVDMAGEKGGHWQVIIGYDTMGTETTQDDVIIVADPYDTTDHNQDGYGVYAAERFLYNFTFYNFFSEESGELNDYCFLVATPEA